MAEKINHKIGEIAEAARIAMVINEELHNQLGEELQGEMQAYAEVRTTGHATVFMMFESVIWSSEGDARTMDPTGEEYEPLEPFIRRRINQYISKIASVLL